MAALDVIYKSKLEHLVTCLAEDQIKEGTQFIFDDLALDADEVGEWFLPLFLAYAQAINLRLSNTDFGFRFIGNANNDELFPFELLLVDDQEPPAPMLLYPVVAHVFLDVFIPNAQNVKEFIIGAIEELRGIPRLRN